MPNTAQKKFQWNRLLPWVELASATVLGIVLYFPLQRKDLADIVWVLGLLLTFNSLAITRNLKEEFDAMRKVSEVVDLSQECDVEGISRILRLYLAIRETEFRPLKNDIVERCIAQLNSLAHEKVAIASGGEYYIWLLDMLRSCSRGERVIAVSVMAEAAWVELPAEKAYLDENINATERGVRIERVFVSSRERLRDKRNREVICQHVEHQRGGLVAYMVWLEELAIQDAKLSHEIGEGFVLFGGRVALIDTSTPPNEAKGTVTMNPEQLKNCERLFERLKLHARVVDTKFLSELDNSRTA